MKGKISVNLRLNPLFLREDGDMSECHCCKDIIYYNQYRLWAMPDIGNVALRGVKTKMVICESCYSDYAE